MRLAITILLGLVLLSLGFVLGGIKPRRELAELRADVAQLEEEVEKAGKRAATRRAVSFLPLPGLERLSGGEPAEQDQKQTQNVDEDDPERQRRRSGRWWRTYRPDRDRRGDASVAGAGAGAGDDDDRPRTPEERMARFDTIADAQKIRADQSRQALREQARLDDREMQTVSKVIGTMNEKLAPHAEVLLGIAESDAEPEPTELLLISKEVASILYEGQTELEGAVGPGKMEEVDDEARQVWNYVDLEMFRPAAERIAERRAQERSAGAGGAVEPRP